MPKKVGSEVKPVTPLPKVSYPLVVTMLETIFGI